MRVVTITRHAELSVFRFQNRPYWYAKIWLYAYPLKAYKTIRKTDFKQICTTLFRSRNFLINSLNVIGYSFICWYTSCICVSQVGRHIDFFALSVGGSFFRWFEFDRFAIDDEQGLRGMWLVEDPQGVLTVIAGDKLYFVQNGGFFLPVRVPVAGTVFGDDIFLCVHR